MPFIKIELSAGRTQEQKEKVAEDVTRAMVEHCGCKPESVSIVFSDVENSNWASGGKFLGQPKS